jgi:hypothetical protein
MTIESQPPPRPAPLGGASAPCRCTGCGLLEAATVVLLVALAWASAAVSPAAATDITVEYDRKFAFSGLSTWAWHPDGAGDVRLAVSADDDPRRVAARLDPVIVPSVERELAARKFTQTTADRADLHVHYYALVTIGEMSQFQGQFVAPVPEWGLPPFVPSTTALSVYPFGTLIIDITAPAREAIVWRGAARRKVNLERPDEERRKVMERAIRDLFRKFPPKTK